ncbi:ProQ/FINO family protein [Halomonas piscis]|uniref:ProQ/FINO family protein n=1 Tax=Halomonas piscis TaxID=3031727 RepID=A0ABY9Z2L2_9GAMM|nr:ProQ/FINO family protein [Halomonas piscis]WNK21132.1 ProQ/FINO family protein [Halomonas piscis]
MPERVTHLLDDLEARLGEARTELATLRDENRRLKSRLAQRPVDDTGEPSEATTPSTAAAEDTPAPEKAAAPVAKAAPEEHAAAPVAKTTPEEHAAAGETPPAPQALLKAWQSRYPEAFAAAEVRPLKVGIHHDLAAREPWSNKLIRRALAGYVNRPRYAKALKEGAPRIDLDGNPAGTVDATAARTAREKYRRQAERKNRPAGAEAPGGKPRRPRRDKAAGPKAPAGKKQGGAAKPQHDEMSQRDAKAPSLEDKLASLQRRFGGRD